MFGGGVAFTCGKRHLGNAAFFFDAHLLEDGHDIRTLQELSGDKDISITMICTHFINRRGKAVKSPADRF